MNTNLNTVIPNDVLRGCNVIVRDCAGLKRYDTVTVISDYATRDIGKFITTVAGSITQNVVHHIIDPFSVHGQEPPDNVALQMCKSDVVFGVTKMSMAHTQARLKASQNGAKYLSLPDYSIDVLTNEALLIDFKSITPLSIYLAELLTEGDKITLWTEAGTDLECNIKDRIANPAPGWCYTKGSIASPPRSTGTRDPSRESRPRPPSKAAAWIGQICRSSHYSDFTASIPNNLTPR